MSFRFDCRKLIVLLLLFVPARARADVSLLLYETVSGASRWYRFGHVAIHLSCVCADAENRLRLCQNGETGIVLSTYQNFGARENYEWLALPLWPSLYAVEDESKVPLYADEKVRALLVETYRRERLSNLVPTSANGQSPPGDWSRMLGAALSRNVYSFSAKTTPAQDAALVEEFNRAPNVNHFNFFGGNCSDFVKKTLNHYFPHSVRRDLFNDLGAMTPKAAAKSFARYAEAHPELDFRVTKYAQALGSIRRSSGAHHVIEEMLFSPKYVLPLVWFKTPVAVAFLSSYFVTGRFNPGKEWREHTSDSRTKQAWTQYKADFAPLLNRAVAEGYFADHNEVRTFFRDLEANSEPAFDETGALILKVCAYGQSKILGLTRANILGQHSDRRLAYKLVLARVNAALNAKEKDLAPREAMTDDWALLIQLAKACATPTEFASLSAAARPRFLAAPAKSKVKRERSSLMMN